jgi:hypothetical protein
LCTSFSSWFFLFCLTFLFLFFLRAHSNSMSSKFGFLKIEQN